MVELRHQGQYLDEEAMEGMFEAHQALEASREELIGKLDETEETHDWMVSERMPLPELEGAANAVQAARAAVESCHAVAEAGEGEGLFAEAADETLEDDAEAELKVTLHKSKRRRHRPKAKRPKV